jgi:4-hydroxy-tetrahydrodipicolinate synthase
LRMPHVLAGILKGVNAGDVAEAERQQAIFAAFRTDLYALGFAPAMVKRALYLQDASVGASRQPALLPNDEQDARIANILREYGLL